MTPDELTAYKEMMTKYPPPENPMTLSFKTESVMSRLISYTHRVIDQRTGELLVNPDGSNNIFYANEESGEVSYHKTHPSKDGTTRLKYMVSTHDRKPIGRWRKRFLEFFGIHEDRIPAQDSYYAPVKFVPMEGREELAAEVRRLYHRQQEVLKQVYEAIEEDRCPTEKTFNRLLDKIIQERES